MASTRPLVHVHATTTDPNGLEPEFEALAKKYFDLITSEELKKDMSQAEKVTGAILFGPRKAVLYELLPNLTNLKVAANFGVGTNHIDFPRFVNLGIKVSNTPDVLNDAVAEMTLALILASARNLIAGDKIVRETTASEYSLNCGYPGLEVKGSTVGIVGMGNIGLTTARLLKAFGANIVYHNRKRRSLSDEESVGAAYYPDLLEMLGVSDFVVVLCPLTPDTRHLISTPQLAAMKPTATLVNVGRGPVVDTDALVVALRTNQIRGAALDVTDPEPLPVGHPLRSEPKVVMAPHWGSFTGPTRLAMFRMVLDNLIAVLIDNVPMPNEVKGTAIIKNTLVG